jgi:hypothetical protein
MLLALIRAAVLNHQERDRPEHAADLILEIFLHGVGRDRRRASRRTARPVRAAGGKS